MQIRAMLFLYAILKIYGDFIYVDGVCKLEGVELGGASSECNLRLLKLLFGISR